MSKDRLRIAYLCDLSPLDRDLYSGGNANIHDALVAHAGDVTILRHDWGAAQPIRRAILALPDGLNMRLRWRAHLALRRVAARAVEAQLAENRFDVLFGAYSLASLAGVRVPSHMVSVFTSDAVQTVYKTSEIGRRFGQRRLASALMDRWVERREAEVLRGTDLLLWPSRWMRDATARRYGLSDDKAHLVPWGANIARPAPPAPRPLSRDAPVRLLVIGRDWFAKGGPVAFDTMQALRKRGIDARLTVIGCQPPEIHESGQVTVHAQLNKAVPEELATFEAALRSAHFLVQPSYESFGFAFCEASAHGLPSLCLDVGGVPVRDGINGHALPTGATPEDFARIIMDHLDAPERYAALTRSARDEYEAHLNWDAWGRRAAALMRAALARKRT